jgi:hypothetical protein
MLIASIVLGVLGASCLLLYRLMELAVTGAHEHIEKSGPAHAHLFGNKFVSIVHSCATVFFSGLILSTMRYGEQDLIRLQHRGTPHVKKIFMDNASDDVCRCQATSARRCCDPRLLGVFVHAA